MEDNLYRSEHIVNVKRDLESKEDKLRMLYARLDEISCVGIVSIRDGKSTGSKMEDIIFMPFQEDSITLDERTKQLKDRIKELGESK